MDLLLSMPGGLEWLAIFMAFVAPIILIIIVVYHNSQQTKLLREIRDEMRRKS